MTGEVMMSRYKCHKEVYALKIKSIRTLPVRLGKVMGEDGAYLYPMEEEYGHIYVDYDYLSKHKPQAGGYYVVYSDNYKSFSPAKAFEEGYTRIV
jgi:hypothetical protein